MRTSPVERNTFVYDPGINETILRDKFVQAPLFGYYKERGFDANFLDWAPEENFNPDGMTWASCLLKFAHTQPCPAGSLAFHPVRKGIKNGDITALRWNGAFIGTYCGNFTKGGGAGPIPQITGTKYEDRNGNGVRDSAEPGLPGWTMNLRYEGNVVASTTTDGEGHYAFALDADHLQIGPGDYQVEEVQQPGWVQSQAPGSIHVQLGAGNAPYQGNDFGNYDPQITAAGQNLPGTEGAEASGTVATFTDPDISATPGEYSATIAWGDGSESPGAVSGIGGTFSVNGGHTYAEEGSYTITVKINDVDNASVGATSSSTATIADAPLSSACATPATTLQAFAGATAAFTDEDPGGISSDYSATIAWGDGGESTGAVSIGTGHGPYTVSGSHTYNSTGYFTITTTITDIGGSRTVAACETLVYAFPSGGGSFVIGDNNAAIATPVTFWDSQWARKNSLSGNIVKGQKVPDAFKGFAKTPAVPSCGTGWSADPGNSSPPPAGSLPAYMGVIVSSTVGRSGQLISGDTVQIVVVKTDAGYQPNPGQPHAGTGTVVARAC